LFFYLNLNRLFKTANEKSPTILSSWQFRHFRPPESVAARCQIIASLISFKFSGSARISRAPNLIATLLTLAKVPSWPKLWMAINFTYDVKLRCRLRRWKTCNEIFNLNLVSWKCKNFDFWDFPRPFLIYELLWNHLDQEICINT